MHFANTSFRHGAQGQLDAAPKNILSTEFGTEDEDEVIKKILEGGSLQQSEVRRLSQYAHDDVLTRFVTDACAPRKQERLHGHIEQLEEASQESWST